MENTGHSWYHQQRVRLCVYDHCVVLQLLAAYRSDNTVNDELCLARSWVDSVVQCVLLLRLGEKPLFWAHRRNPELSLIEF